VAAGATVVTAVLIRSSPGDHVSLSSNRSTTSTPTTSQQQPSPAQPPTTAAPAEEVAAQALSQLLTQSASDRNAIDNARNDVQACGSDLASDAQTFQQAASSRQNLLSELGALADSTALPAQLLQDLTGAWQASYQADQDYAAWASDENSNGCADDTSDSNLLAATDPDNRATTDKQAFVGLWNPIASQYGLTTYQWNQL
jgi:ABC-type Fe2+-enterobactin transport system substrate-binding protein